jgi:flagellar motor switch/type III secretory pathway protein FliN
MNEQAKPTSQNAGSRSSLEDAWAEAQWLPCKLNVVLPVPQLTVGDLLDMQVDSIIDCHVSEDTPLPVWVNETIIGWAEFDVMGKKLAIRITELR